MELEPWVVTALTLYFGFGAAYGAWTLIRKWYLVQYESGGIIPVAAGLALIVFVVAMVLWLPILLERAWKGLRRG